MATLRRTVALPASAAEAFAWHERSGAFERLAPPWDPVRVVERRGGIGAGDHVVLELRRGPLRLRWRAEHRDYRPGRSFTDVQTRGPFARWTHVHSFEPDGDDACRLEDHVEYALPGGALGAALAGGALRRRLEHVFAFRQRRTAGDLAAHASCRREGALAVALTGASGLLGSALVPYLTTGGHRVTRLVRTAPAPGEVRWDAAAASLDGSLEGVDAIVHLASEDVAAGRGGAAREQQLHASPVLATRQLAQSLAALERPPRVFVCASGRGFHGERDERLDADSAAGTGFPPDLTRAWEAATEPLVERGVRVVHLRLGVVLTPTGGALARLLPHFRLGLGGPIGHGRQWLPWIALDDALDALHAAVTNKALHGPLDVVAPQGVTNAEFTRTLGRVLRRPARLTLPAALARLACGEAADALLLASARVEPQGLLAQGFRFRHATLDDALRHMLGA